MPKIIVNFASPPELINEFGSVTWSDLQRMCQKTELSEEDVIHLALKSLLACEDSLYPPDDGPSTPIQKAHDRIFPLIKNCSSPAS